MLKLIWDPVIEAWTIAAGRYGSFYHLCDAKEALEESGFTIHDSGEHKEFEIIKKE